MQAVTNEQNWVGNSEEGKARPAQSGEVSGKGLEAFTSSEVSPFLNTQKTLHKLLICLVIVEKPKAL